mmetsp:Transcript_50165/g.86298  ORF Transcript_50165/g.86298 Transcript_50165/m.86298 type:complete len:182 (+) Transcript_50165:184-729(+)
MSSNQLSPSASLDASEEKTASSPSSQRKISFPQDGDQPNVLLVGLSPKGRQRLKSRGVVSGDAFCCANRVQTSCFGPGRSLTGEFFPRSAVTTSQSFSFATPEGPRSPVKLANDDTEELERRRRGDHGKTPSPGHMDFKCPNITVKSMGQISPRRARTADSRVYVDLSTEFEAEEEADHLG